VTRESDLYRLTQENRVYGGALRLRACMLLQ
jgi:hypothetical protein